MNRTLLVARHEYGRQARRRGFLLATFGLPLLVFAGYTLLFLYLLNSVRPEASIGYVDPGGLLTDVSLPEPAAGEDPWVPLQPFADEAAAEAARASGQIAAYAVIPPDYATSGALTIYGVETLSPNGRTTLQAALNRGLLAQAGTPPAVAERALEPLGEIDARTPAGAVINQLAPIGRGIVAIMGSLLFMVTIFFSASYLLQALVEEKENRTMEVVTTSITPWQLIGGKTLGLGLLGLTIALAWLGVVAIAWMVGRAFFTPLREVPLPLDTLVPLLFVLPLGYLLFAGLMVAISAVVTTAQEGQQFAGVVTLTAALPLMATAIFFSDPNGLIATFLSLFPLTAPVGMALRLVTGAVPLWQLVLSVLLLALAAGLAVWGAARIFRVGMLQYGKRLSLQDTLRALRTP
ncbi:MAG: ABC transporter permease [Chloroflexaceae bacterium]|jgi:ABC-2 type transport system permease protein|nr:ABC transporter permease [Chloroflexaceae bacterium]